LSVLGHRLLLEGIHPREPADTGLIQMQGRTPLSQVSFAPFSDQAQ